MSDFWAGVLAAAIGGVITAAGAWATALLFERRRENLQLLGAMEMTRDEVDENARRLEKGRETTKLTLGVWEYCKPILAGVGRRAIDEMLWKDLHEAYRMIYERKSGEPLDPNLTDEKLKQISSQLTKASELFDRQRRRPRYWVSFERNLRR